MYFVPYSQQDKNSNLQPQSASTEQEGIENTDIGEAEEEGWACSLVKICHRRTDPKSPRHETKSGMKVAVKKCTRLIDK